MYIDKRYTYDGLSESFHLPNFIDQAEVMIEIFIQEAMQKNYWIKPQGCETNVNKQLGLENYFYSDIDFHLTIQK